jgi:hypothetical protein
MFNAFALSSNASKVSASIQQLSWRFGIRHTLPFTDHFSRNSRKWSNSEIFIIELDEQTAATLEHAARLEGREEEALTSRILKETLADPVLCASLDRQYKYEEESE